MKSKQIETLKEKRRNSLYRLEELQKLADEQTIAIKAVIDQLEKMRRKKS